MGDPVKIVDLARNMIRLSGKEPDVDIAIEIVGPAPGREDPRGAVRARRAPPADSRREDRGRRAARAWTPEWVEDAFARIEELVYAGDAAALADAVAELSAERSLTAHYAPMPGQSGVPDPR